jgi:16S rRNA (guanine527-N7)-methyltransferase
MLRALDALCGDLGVALGDDARRGFCAYGALVATWSMRTDLVAARMPEALAELLFADALAALGAGVFGDAGTFVDVGAGVGAPTLPLLVALPAWSAVLVEPRRKRVAFLRTAIGALDLGARARVVEAHVSLTAPDVPGAPFDVALSRATFAPAEWLPIGAALARRTLVLIAREEPPAASAGLVAGTVHRYALPSSGAPRSIATYDRDDAASSTRPPG